MIRDATPEDFEAIAAMGVKFWDSTDYEEPGNFDHIMTMVKMCYDHGLLIVTDDRKGFISGVRSPLLGSGEVEAGSEVAYWVEPECRGSGHAVALIRGIEEKAKSLGVKYWAMSSLQCSMPEKVRSLYESLGYKHSESTFTRVL